MTSSTKPEASVDMQAEIQKMGFDAAMAKALAEMVEIAERHGRAAAYEECASFLAREYPDNANTNAFCAALRAEGLARAATNSQTGNGGSGA